jgi:DNA-binding MarR family transcriptional regulator
MKKIVDRGINSGASTSMLSVEDYKIWVMMGHTNDAILKVRKIEIADYGITPVETTALYILNEIGHACSPAEISRKMVREHSAVLALLKRMEKKGLVVKTKDSVGRSWEVSLTEKGKITCDKATKLESVHDALSTLSENDKKKLEEFLVAIYEKATSSLYSHQFSQ